MAKTKLKTKKFKPFNQFRSPLRLANFLLVFAITGVLVLIATSAALLPGWYGSIETDQVKRMNSARASIGKGAYQHIECLNAVAESWTTKMVNAGKISHNPNLASEATARCGSSWQVLGENVGVGYESGSLFNAFMNSPAHKANILSTCTTTVGNCGFEKVGVGAYVSKDGRLWITHVFANCVTCSGAWATGASVPADPKPPTPAYLGAIGLKADFNGDGYSDVMFYRPGGENDDRIWYGTATRNQHITTVENAVGTYRPITGDFNGDKYSDILWYAPGTATDRIWYGTATMGTFSVVNLPATNGTYIPIPGNFDGDAYDDVLYYGVGSTGDYIHFGTATKGVFNTSYSAGSISGTYTPIPGDFNGDGKGDIFWWSTGTYDDSMWYGTATKGSFSRVEVPVTGTAYRPVSGDFDGDGKYDIYWYGPGSVSDTTWYGTATKGSFTHHSIPSIAGSYIPIPGDFDGDGKDDVLFYVAGEGADYLQSGTATKGSFSSLTTSPINLSYSPIPF